MADVFDMIGDAFALISRETAGTLGKPFTLVHRGGTGVSIVAHITDQRVEEVQDGRSLIERRVMDLEIGTGQTGFAKPTSDITEPITAGDKLTDYLSRVWYVNPPIRKNPLGTIYYVTVVERKTLAKGI